MEDIGLMARQCHVVLVDWVYLFKDSTFSDNWCLLFFLSLFSSLQEAVYTYFHIYNVKDQERCVTVDM